MINCPECDKFPPHLAEICNGSKLIDDKPIDQGYVTKFRSQFGLPPIGEWKGEEAIYPLPYDSGERFTTETKRVQNYIHPQAAVPYHETIQFTLVSFRPTRWVGTNLAQLLKKFGVEIVTGCGGCDAWMNEMNVWGPDKCEGEHFNDIKERLKTKADELKSKEGSRKIIRLGLNMIIRAQWPSIDALIKKAIKQARQEIKRGELA